MTLIIIISIILIAIILYYVLFPENFHLMVSFKSGNGLTFSKTGIEYDKKPDFYPQDGFDYIASYITKLAKYSTKFKSLIISTKDGEKALGLDSKNGEINVGFTIEWKTQPKEETSIREYFEKLNIKPHEDYLADNGGIKDSTRLLDYNITRSEEDVTKLVKEILIKLIGITEFDELNIRYDET